MHKFILTAFHYNLINNKKNIYNTTQFSFSEVVSVKELAFPLFSVYFDFTIGSGLGRSHKCPLVYSQVRDWMIHFLLDKAVWHAK